MHVTVLVGICVFFWYLAFWAAVFSTVITPVMLAIVLGLVFLTPRAFGRLINERLCAGGLTMGGTLLRNAAVFLPYTILTVGLFVLLSGRPDIVSQAVYHTAGQAFFWFLGALTVYLPEQNKQLVSPSVCMFAAIPAILLLAATGARVSVVFLCMAGWYFSLVCSLAVKSGLPLRQAEVFLHSIIPLTVVILTVGLVFSGSLNAVFAQVKHLLLLIWQLILPLLDSLNTPPDEYTLRDRSHQSFGEAFSPAQEFGPFNTLPVIILGVCAAIITVVLLTRILIGFWNRRLPQQASATRPPRRFGVGLSMAARLFGFLLRSFAGGMFAFIRLVCLLCRHGKKQLLALMPPRTPLESVLRSYRGLLGFGRLLRIHRVRSETPMEYLARLQACSLQRPLAIAEAQALTQHFVEVQYGGVVPNWQTAAECRRLLQTIRRSGRTIFTRSKKDALSLTDSSKSFM